MSNYTIYRGIEHLNRLSTSHTIAFDVETLQLKPEIGKLRLVQLASKQSKAIVVIDCFDLEDEGWEQLKYFFDNGALERYWLAHNAVFDVGWLQEQGIHIRGRVGCTMLANRLITNGIPNAKQGLADLALRHLRVYISKEQQKSNWGAEVLSEEQILYAAKDVELLLDLEEPLERNLIESNLMDAYFLECRALPAMAQMWRTGLPWNKESLANRIKDFEFDVERMGKDFLRDLDSALPLKEKLPRDVDHLTKRLEELEDKVTRMGFDDRTYEGWYSEIDDLKTQIKMAPFNLRAKDSGSIRQGTKKYKGFNINSPKQLLHKFTILLGKEPTDNNGKGSCSRTALRSYAADHVIIQTYLDWKRAEKRRQMLVSIQEKMEPDGFVRASYMQLGADTGRMSCLKPNNQQIPRDDSIRQCVEAPKNWSLVDADFGQMELRLAGAIAKDKNMIEAFKEGKDLHDYTAESMGCERQIAKSANFGLLYGAGAEGLRNYAGANGILISEERAREIRQDWLKTFSGIRDWQQKNSFLARSTEGNKWAEIRIPETYMRRYLMGDLNKVTVRCNTPVQGAGAAILKCALGNMWPLVKEAGEDVVRIAAAVHDEILLLVRDEHSEYWASVLKREMENAEAKWLGDIPAIAETSIGKTWGEVH